MFTDMTSLTIQMRKDLSKTVIELIDKCFEQVTPKNFEDQKIYRTFNVYRHRWQNDKLGEKQIVKVLDYFGYDVTVKKTYSVTKRKKA